MEINWILVIVCFLVNTCCLSGQFGLQYLDLSHQKIQRRGTLIPGTNQCFLYMQDFATNSWGDLLGLSLIQTGFAHLWVTGCLSLLEWTELVLVATITSGIFLYVCLQTHHKPDSGFPEIGKISSSGKWHIPYFGINAGIAAVDIHLLFGPLRGSAMWLSLAGGAIYVVAIACDIAHGNFASLQPANATPSRDQ